MQVDYLQIDVCTAVTAHLSFHFIASLEAEEDTVPEDSDLDATESDGLEENTSVAEGGSGEKISSLLT